MKRIPDAIFIVDPKKRESVFRKLILWEFRLSVSVIPTVIRKNWIMLSRVTMMLSVP